MVRSLAEMVLQSVYVSMYEKFWIKEFLYDPIYVIHVAAFH